MRIGDFLIQNDSGRLELSLTKDGVWLFIEDRQDCCSIGLDKAEIDVVIGKLLELKGSAGVQ